ncbi:MAG: dihydroxyacetone kinase family protein [Alkalispirochaeta sp.]
MLTIDTAKEILHNLNQVMAENQDYLIQIDSVIGDGDLGLTMSKAFRTADEQLAGADEDDVGMFFAKAGMAMAKAAPSTMGSLVATGFMKGGKAVKGKSEWAAADVATFFRAFSDGVMERGKTQPGNKTIVDVLDPVAGALEAAVDTGADFATLAERAVEAARQGEEAARNMTSQHGKAAIYREQTVGKQDPGAAAGLLIVQGFFSVF